MSESLFFVPTSKFPMIFLKELYSACLRTSRKARRYEELNARAFVSLSVVDVREDPVYQSPMVTQVLMGTPVKVHYSPKGKYWIYIETPEGCCGWINNLAVQMTDEKGIEQWKKSKRLIVTSETTHFLESPEDGAQRMSDAVAGCVVNGSIDDVHGDFLKVVLYDGRTAYVKSADVDDFERWSDARVRMLDSSAGGNAADCKAVQTAILNSAKNFVGVPFQWKGRTIKGLDCCGLVRYAFLLNGLHLPDTLKQMSCAGRQLDLDSGADTLQPADLLFFGHETGKKDDPFLIKHVAIYMGNEMIVHSSHFVRINNVINEKAPDAYVRKILKAVRIVGYSDRDCSVESLRRCSAYFAD